MTAAAVALPAGPRAAPVGLPRDDLVKRGLMVVISLYLVLALAAPLYVMLSKSFSTYRFDLDQFEFQVSDETRRDLERADDAPRR